MSLNPGARLGAYEIVAPLGAGGQPQVYNIEYHLQRFSPERLKTVIGSRLRYISQSGVPSLFPVHFVATYIK